MAIIGAKIEWMQRFANAPQLHVVVDKEPNWDRPIWNRTKDGMMWAKKGNLITYIYMPLPPMDTPTKGFGGRRFTYTLKDGTVCTSDNCWSSRASCLPFFAMDVYVHVGSLDNVGCFGYAVNYAVAKELVEGLGAYLHVTTPYHDKRETVLRISASPTDPEAKAA